MAGKLKKLSSQRGNALLSGLMLAGIVAGAAGLAYRNFENTYSSTRVARIKSKQAIVEAQVRRRALQPEAYAECNSTNLATCRVNENYFADLAAQSVSGAHCAKGIKDCGVSVSGVKINPATRQFSAEVGYAGSEVKLKPLQVKIDVPIEVLQSARFHCGEKDKTKPIFTGFDSAGSPVCEGFTPCPAGQFVKGVDVSRRKLICQALPAPVSCPSQSMLTRVGWQGHELTHACGALSEPPFVSKLRTRTIASKDPRRDQPGETVIETSTETDTHTGTATQTETNTATRTSTETGTGQWKFNTPTSGDIYSECWAGVYTVGDCRQGVQSNTGYVIPVNQESGPTDCPNIPDLIAWGNIASAGTAGSCQQKGAQCRYRTPGTPKVNTGSCITYTTAGSERCGFTCR